MRSISQIKQKLMDSSSLKSPKSSLSTSLERGEVRSFNINRNDNSKLNITSQYISESPMRENVLSNRKKDTFSGINHAGFMQKEHYKMNTDIKHTIKA